jgi:hypothetical protein
MIFNARKVSSNFSGVIQFLIVDLRMRSKIEAENVKKKMDLPNPFSGAVAGCASEFSEMIQDVLSRWSGAAQF